MWRRGGRSGDPCLEIVAVAAAHSSVLLTPHKVLPDARLLLRLPDARLLLRLPVVEPTFVRHWMERPARTRRPWTPLRHPPPAACAMGEARAHDRRDGAGTL